MTTSASAYEYSEAVDDVPAEDGSPAFTGVVSATKAIVLQATELAKLVNGDIGAYGTAGSRQPAALVATGLADDFLIDGQGNALEDELGNRLCGEDYVGDTQYLWFFNGTTKQLLFFAEGALYVCLSPNAAQWTKSAQSFNQNGRIACAQLSNAAYVVDEQKLRAYRQSDGQWTFSDVAYFKVYDDTQKAYVDDPENPIPPAGVIETHIGRLCLAGIEDQAIEPDAVYFSDYLDGTVWERVNQIVVGGDGDPIVALQSWRENVLLVFKRNSVWAVVCAPTVDDSGEAVSPAQWTVKKLSDSYGCVSRESVAQVGNDVWFLSKSGVVSVTRAAAASESSEISLLPISNPVQDVIDAIHWQSAWSACAVFFKDRYFLSVPINYATRPNATLIYNTLLGKWQGSWQGTAMRQTGYARATFDEVEQLLWRTHDAAVYRWEDSELSDYTDKTDSGLEAYTMELTSKSYVFSAPLNQKRPRQLEVEFWQSTGLAHVLVSLDGREPVALSPAEGLALSNSPQLPLQLPFALGLEPALRFNFSIRHLPRFRELQVIVRSQQGRARVRNLSLTALPMPGK